jgi:hypothetical protein
MEDKTMRGNKERVNRAQDRALERLDYVIDCREAFDFVEVTGRMGAIPSHTGFTDGGSITFAEMMERETNNKKECVAND